MAWLAGWSYRKEITITGQSGAGTNYQVDLDIGDSAGGDLHLEGHCTNFPQDIQVTDNDGTTLLDFWIEDITADPLTMWVKVADDLGSNQTIYVYYGKSGETTASNGDNTLEFYDGFDRTDSETVGNGWTETEPASIVGNNLFVEANSTDGRGKVTKPFTPSGTMAYECKFKPRTEANTGAGIYYHVYGTSANKRMGLMIGYYDLNSIRYITGGSWVDTGEDATLNVYHKFKIIHDSISSTYSVYFNGVELASGISASSSAVTNLIEHMTYYDGSYTSDQYVDWTFVRKYNSPEPAFSSAGSEETLGWIGIINGITNPASIIGIAVADIAKVNGI